VSGCALFPASPSRIPSLFSVGRSGVTCESHGQGFHLYLTESLIPFGGGWCGYSCPYYSSHNESHLKRVFAIDIEQCPQCGGTLKIIAALEDPTVMAKILTHLGLSISAPPRATFAVIRSTPNGLIQTDPRFTPVQSLSRHSPLTFTRARRQTASKFGTERRSMARKVPDSRPRTRVFDNSTHPAVLFLSTKKGVYFSYTF
jgi:hypothetical protein